MVCAGPEGEGFSTITADVERVLDAEEDAVERASDMFPSSPSSSSSTVGWCHDGEGVRLALVLVLGVSCPRGSGSDSTCGDADWIVEEV